MDNLMTTFAYELEVTNNLGTHTHAVHRDQARDFMNDWHTECSVDGDRGERTYANMYGDRLTIRVER